VLANPQVPFRKRVRVFTEERRVEGVIIFIVLVYFLVICLDFTVPVIVKAIHGSFTSGYQTFCAPAARRTRTLAAT